MNYKGSWLINYYLKDYPRYRAYKKRLPARPYHCIFSVTNSCTSKCIMCNFWKNKHENELSLDEIKNIFSQDFFKSIDMISITGGDALLRPDIAEIVDIMYALTKKPVCVSTSGLLPHKLDQLISRKKDKLSGIHLSIDGLEETHNYVRGRKDAFQRTVECINVVKKHGFTPGITMTAMKANYDQVLKTKEYFRDCIFSYKTVQNSEFYFGDNSDFDLNLDDKMKASLVKQIRQIPDRDLYTAFLEDWILYDKRPLPCYAGAASFYLDSTGNVYPCIHKGVLGNVRQTPIDQIWNSPKANKFRQTHAKCQDCYERCTVETFAIDAPYWVFKYRIKKLKKMLGIG